MSRKVVFCRGLWMKEEERALETELKSNFHTISHPEQGFFRTSSSGLAPVSHPSSAATATFS